MDLLDIKIFRELAQDKEAYSLQFDIRKSLSSISKNLGIDEDTVRNRIEKFKQTGFLRGWTVLVNPNLIGLGVAQLFLDIPRDASKLEIIGKLKKVNGVSSIINCFGSSLIVFFLYGKRKPFISQKRAIEKVSMSAKTISVMKPFPECKVRLSHTDVLILRSIRKEPRKLYSVISKETGVSSRTVKRRLDWMVKEKALLLAPDLNLKKIEGLASLSPLIIYDSYESKIEAEPKILSHLQENIAVAELHDPLHAFMILVIPNISGAEEIAEWLRSQPGVKAVRLDIEQDRIEVYQWFEKQLEDSLMGMSNVAKQSG